MPNPTENSVRDYLRAVTGAEDGQAQAQPDWKIPHTTAGTTIETSPIRGEQLDSIERSIMDDNTLSSFEELSVLREAYLERQRMRQVADRSPLEQVQAIEYRINNIRLHRRLVLENKDTLLKAQKLKDDMAALGIQPRMNPDIAANAFAHLDALTGAVKERLALGQLALLFNQKKDGKVVPPELLSQAIANAPTFVRAKKTGETAEAVINKAALEKMPAEQALSALEEPIRISEENMGWTLTYDATVAGVSEEYLGINPVDVYYNELLAEAVGAATQREFDLARQPNNSAETQRIREFRDKLRAAFNEDLVRLQNHAIGNLRGVSTDFADTTYAPGTEQRPYIFPPRLIGQLPELQGQSQRQVQTVIAAFRERARNVMGGTDEQGNSVRGLMDMSIFDFKDSWMPTVDTDAMRLRQEDFYKKHVRFKVVYPLLDALTRTMAAPDVLGRAAIRTGVQTFTPFEGPAPLTFKGEAERAMVHMRRAWKLPENVTINGETVPFDFYNPAHWDTLTPAQWAEIEKSQTSTMDALTKNRDTMANSLQAIEGDLRSFEALYALANPDTMVGVMPDEKTFADLQTGAVSVGLLVQDPEALKSNPAKLAACYYFVIHEMEGHSAQYAENFRTLSAELNDIGNYDIDTASEIEAAGRDVGIPYWFFAMTGGLMAWYTTAYFRAKAPLRFVRATAVMGRDVSRTIRFGYRNSIGRLRGQAAAPVGEAARLQETVTQQADELARATQRITQLEQEVTQLKGAGQEAAQQVAQKEAEIARLSARTLELEEQLAKATQVPGVVARRTETLARVAQFVEGSGADIMQRVAANQRAIATTETTIKEILSLTDDTARAARATELATLQTTLGELLRADRTLRIDAAKTLLGEGVNVTDEAAELIWRAHITESLPGKVKLLRQAMGLVYENADEASKAANLLARSGIAGDVATVLERSTRLASEVVPDAAVRLAAMGLPEGSELMLKLAGNPRTFQFLNEAFQVAGAEGASRAAKYLAAIGEEAAEALTDPVLVKAIVTSGEDATKIGLTMTKLVTNGHTAADCAALLNDLAVIRRVGPRALSGLETTLLVAGPLIEAGMLGYDIYELVQAQDRQAEQIKSMVGSLDQLVAQGLMTKEGDTYKGPGCAIDVKQIKDMSATEVEAQWARTAVDAASFVGTTATSIVVLSGMAGPPGLAAGLVVAGVIITVHAGISIVEGSIDQYRRSEFLRAAPPWLVAIMGPEGLVGQSTEDVIREHTGTMRSEYLPRSWGEAALQLNPVTGPVYAGGRGISNSLNAEQMQADKQAVKEKAMQALAYRSFAASHPEFMSELPERGDVQKLLMPGSDFLKPGGDYERIVRPLITLQMQASARPGLVGVSGFFGYESAPDVGAIDRLVLPERSQLDAGAVGVDSEAQLLEESGARAMTFYVHHLREQRYRQAISAIESDVRYDGDYKAFLINEYDEYIDNNKSHHYVFNVHPKTLSRSGPTLAEKLIQDHALTPERMQAFNGDTISAAEAASMGYSFPDGRQNMSLRSFLSVYVEPDHTKETEQRLESYSAQNADLPFSFEAMEDMKSDADFESTVGRTLDRMVSINNALRDPGSLGTDAAIRTAFDAVSAADIDLFLRFRKHEEFYNLYLTRWRKDERYVSLYAAPWIERLTAWKEKGYPALIDEAAFSRAQQSLVRPANNPLQIDGDIGWLRDAEKRLPGFQYDPERPNRILSTYRTYMTEASRLPYTEARDPFADFRRRTPFDELLRQQEEGRQTLQRRDNAITRLRGDLDRMREERNVRVRDGSVEGRTLSSFRTLPLSIAVEDKDLLRFVQGWMKDDGFDALRSEMLASRTFVISDPTRGLDLSLEGRRR